MSPIFNSITSSARKVLWPRLLGTAVEVSGNYLSGFDQW